MILFDLFKRKSPSNIKSSASDAKGRLQVIIAQERSWSGGPDFLQMMRGELLDVVRKYIDVDPSAISVHMDKNGDCEMLEVNVVLPDRIEFRKEITEAASAKNKEAPPKPKGRVKKNRRR